MSRVLSHLGASGVAARAACCCALTLVLLAPAASAAPPAGSRIEFHGWSPDSQHVAYTRVRNRPPARKGGRAIVDRQRRHRRIADGDFAGFGKMSGGDVARYARTKKYVAKALPAASVSPHVVRFKLEGYTLTMHVEAETEHIAWSLRDAETVIARHFFDALYVSVEVDLYPAPDGTQAVIVMHLDTGWVTDAAIYPVLLPATRKPMVVGVE